MTTTTTTTTTNIETAIAYLDADADGDGYTYIDATDGTAYRVARPALEALGRALRRARTPADRAGAYSLWCADPTCPAEELVTAEVMPEHLRASHEAAGYSSIEWCGQYPVNGAQRSQVTRDEADALLEEHGDWARVIK